MAGFPIEIVNTTFLFLFFAFLASLVNLYLKRAKALSRDNVQCVPAARKGECCSPFAPLCAVPRSLTPPPPFAPLPPHPTPPSGSAACPS